MPLSGRFLPVSSDLTWLLHHWRSDGRAPVPEAPRPASAIVFVRDSLEGLQTFVMRQADARGIEDRNRWAYPGGNLRPGDLRKLPLVGWDSARCARALKIENKSRALHHFSAAARIAFATTGVLLAENIDRDIVDTPQTDWGDTRARLYSNEISWTQILRERDLKLRSDLCKPWLRWINTGMQLRRFDTTYFLSTVPFGQEIDFLSPNENWGGWMSPRAILEDAGDDADRIGASTRLIVESLLEIPSVGAAMAQVRDVHPIRPEIVEDDGAWKISVCQRSDPYRKGTTRDYDVAVGDAEDEDRPGFVSLGGESDTDTNREDTDET